MKSISKLAIASSITVLLAGCGSSSEVEQGGPTSPVQNVNEENESDNNVTGTPNDEVETSTEEPIPVPALIPAQTGNTPTGTTTEEDTTGNAEPFEQPPETPSNVPAESEQAPQTPEEMSAETESDSSVESHSANIEEGSINLDYLNAVEYQLTNTPLMNSVKASISTIDNGLVEQIEPLRAANPSNVQRVESILSATDWEFVFPKRAPEYSYEKFLKAVGKFPAFCGDYDDGRDAEAICRKSLATMFAHFTQETGGHTAHWDVEEWRQGLVHVREMGWSETMRGGYNGECNPDVWQGQTWPCGTFDDGEFKSYFGRGAKQLSYNYNYGPFSEAMFGDVSVLLEDPGLVADTWLNLASAVFFYVYPQPPKPSMLHVIDGTWQPNERDLSNGLVSGFGVTTQIINGGVECGGSTEIAQSLNRISYYKSFADYLGVSVPDDEILGCAGMKQFDSQGDGALNIYWEQDWSFVAENPDGASYACKLVGYQTPFSAFKEGDYAKCVEHHFDVLAVNEGEWIDEEQPVAPPAQEVEPETGDAENIQADSETETQENVGNDNALPENTVGNVSSPEENSGAVVDVENMTPATPTIAWMAGSYAATEVSLTVSWDMWWGINGNTWFLELDGQEVFRQSLSANGNQAQSGSTPINVVGEGSHTLEVFLCNSNATVESCSSNATTIALTGDTGMINNGSVDGIISNPESGNHSQNENQAIVETAEIEAGMYGDLNKVYEQTSGKVIASYFVEWGVYGRDYHVNNIPASNLTHLLYGFLAICGENPQATPGAKAAIERECASKEDNEITIIDSFATLEKTYPGDTWSDNVYGDHYNGNFGQLRKLKQRYPDLKILPSIGGWTLSTPFFAMAKDPAQRSVFTGSVVEFLNKYEFFDGVDIDWEFPGVDGADIGYASAADREGYTALMKDLRDALDILSSETGRDYEITSAVGAGPDKIDAVDYTEAHQYMDYIFMMTYDYAGAWESTTGHHTPLNGNQEFHEGYNTSDAVERMLSQGASAASS